MNAYNKISVIGAGFVGSATVFALMQSGIASQIKKKLKVKSWI